MTRAGLGLAAALLILAPLHVRADEASDETTVIQDASGRIIVVPKPAAAPAPTRTAPVRRPAPTAATSKTPLGKRSAQPAAPAPEGVDACTANDDLVASWQAAHERVAEAREALEAAESIPLSGMGGYRDSRIAAAERELEKAETRESELDATARKRGVPPGCFDD